MQIRYVKKSFVSLLIMASLQAKAQEPVYPADTPIGRIQNVMDEFDTIPPIIYNEKEISLEEYSQLDATQYGTCIFLNMKPLAEQLAGERGKNGLIYIHKRKDYFPWPSPLSGGYFQDGDFPVEFPEGSDSLFNFIRVHQNVSKEILKSDIDGEVIITCYFDEEGQIEKCEMKKILLKAPMEAILFSLDGEIPQTWFLNKRVRKILDKIVSTSLDVIKTLPSFHPATFYLRHVKYMMDLSVPVRYDTMQRSID